MITKEKLKRLARKWQKRQEEYTAGSHDRGADYLDRARYEGHSIALRWVIEDLEKLLK